MVFRDRTYSVLLASPSEKFTEAVRSLLPVTDYWPIVTAKSASEASARLKDQSFDIIILNTPFTDSPGFQVAIEQSRGNAGILVFTPKDSWTEVTEKLAPKGILTVPKPAALPTVQLMISAARAVCERLCCRAEKEQTVGKEIEEMRIINHAKWLLIQNLNMTEPEAHRYIEKRAMDMRQSRLKVAQEIITTYN